MAEIEKMDLESEDIVGDRIEQLKRMFPEIVTERGFGERERERERVKAAASTLTS